jgi:very-short-patch-repair endonuclease
VSGGLGGRSGSWDDFVKRASPSFESPYERAFVERVLTRVSGLSPALVRTQQQFTDAQGKAYRMDFAIVEEPFIHIALEVDGYDKSGTGSGMTRAQFAAWVARQAELTSQRWQVLRFANSQFMRDPVTSARFIELTLRETRAVAEDRAIARGQLRSDSQAEPLTAAERDELVGLRARATEEMKHLREGLAAAERQAAAKQAENSRMVRVVVALSVVFAAALLAVALVARGSGGSGGAPTGSATAPVGGNCPSGYAIKGNVNPAGARIYHVVGGEFYNATRPERCFSTEAAAQAEGFRRSQR